MNRKGFTLIELLGCFAILAVVLGIGLYSTRGTLATTLSTLTGASENEVFNASSAYVLEYSQTWINEDIEYTCLNVKNLVDAGYFDESEVVEYEDYTIKVVRDPKTKVINKISFVESCN